MDFIIKLLYSLFFAAISFILFMKYNNAFSIKPKLLIILLLNLILLFYLNTIYTSISNKLFYILLMFSLSVVILNIMKNFISIENNAVLKNNDRFRNSYKNVKNIFFIKVIPIIIFFYQLLLIWVPSISAKCCVININPLRY
ncbi:hypothetical protein SAMN02787074_1548 [Chryseobacterium sp. YR221]|nr:hypothetical protein SAMN02787074_1548 [Chryseobacterium sp. YR221]